MLDLICPWQVKHTVRLAKGEKPLLENSWYYSGTYKMPDLEPPVKRKVKTSKPVKQPTVLYPKALSSFKGIVVYNRY